MAITVVNASWAAANAGFDVTGICQAMVNNGNDDITANNTTFGDPQPGVPKYFAIVYRTPSSTQVRACGENDSLDLGT